MTRVHGHARKPGSNAPLGFKHCQWCGEEYAVRGTGQLFCSADHKTAFNNLRKARGALVIDLLMTWRYDRGLAAKLKIWSEVCTMLYHFRQEDRAQRAGRKSWMPPMTTIQNRPDLFNMPRGRNPKKKKD